MKKPNLITKLFFGSTGLILLASLWSGIQSGVYDYFYTILAVVVVVLIGEVISLKNSGITISEKFPRFSLTSKITLIVTFVVWALTLVLHFQW